MRIFKPPTPTRTPDFLILYPSALGKWGRMQMRSDGLSRILTGLYLFSPVGLCLVPLKTDDVKGFRPDFDWILTGFSGGSTAPISTAVTSPICNTLPCWLLTLEKGKRRNTPPNLYYSTPPICAAIRFPFVRVILVTRKCPYRPRGPENFQRYKK